MRAFVTYKTCRRPPAVRRRLILRGDKRQAVETEAFLTYKMNLPAVYRELLDIACRSVMRLRRINPLLINVLVTLMAALCLIGDRSVQPDMTGTASKCVFIGRDDSFTSKIEPGVVDAYI